MVEISENEERIVNDQVPGTAGKFMVIFYPTIQASQSLGDPSALKVKP